MIGETEFLQVRSIQPGFRSKVVTSIAELVLGIALTKAWTKYAETDWLCKVARDRVGRVITRLMRAHRSTVNWQFVINYAPILGGLTKLAIFSFRTPNVSS
jgi:hypothetical protein